MKFIAVQGFYVTTVKCYTVQFQTCVYQSDHFRKAFCDPIPYQTTVFAVRIYTGQ